MTSIRSLAEELAYSAGLRDQISIELYRARVLHFRQLILVREYNKTRNWNPSIVQAFDVKLEKFNKYSDIAYRSEVLPKSLLVSYLKTPFISVGNPLTAGNRKTYDYISPEQVEFIQYRKFSTLKDYYTFENDMLISFSKPILRVRSVFEDPIKVKEFSQDQDIKLNCNTSLDDGCFVDDDLELENSVAAAIMTFFTNNSTDRHDRTRRERAYPEEYPY